MSSTSTAPKPAPPANAVAKDDHWARTMARLDKLKPAVATLTICPDPKVRAHLEEARTERDNARAMLEEARAASRDDDPNGQAVAYSERRLASAQTALGAAQAAFDEQAIVLRFQALSRSQLEKLQAEHPPTEDEEAEGNEVHEDTFAPALIAAASLDGMPIQYAQQCLDTWSPADAQALLEAAYAVQRQQRTDLGKG